MFKKYDKQLVVCEGSLQIDLLAVCSGNVFFGKKD